MSLTMIEAPKEMKEFQEATGFRGLVDRHNGRIKLYGMSANEFAKSMECAELIADFGNGDGISKLTVYSPDASTMAWGSLGFRPEATIRGYFADSSDATLFAIYGDKFRDTDINKVNHDEIVETCAEIEFRKGSLPEGYRMEFAEAKDAELLAGVLNTCFPDYPSDLSPETLAKNIASRASHFRLVFDQNNMPVAVASLELDHEMKSAELTDCATLPDQRGRGLMTAIMQALEEDAREQFGIVDLYTIARAVEHGMNKAFAKCGYTYTGRLINNCRMPNGWESMNVWCKQLG